jgi:hypothetical protein
MSGGKHQQFSFWRVCSRWIAESSDLNGLNGGFDNLPRASKVKLRIAGQG